ncbi:MAG TPA: hypothetical protein VKB76_14560, partial [Ktedonobacterales bacterium]|nr:hypothetical protein [Ktedonobacterales bacterium]
AGLRGPGERSPHKRDFALRGRNVKRNREPVLTSRPDRIVYNPAHHQFAVVVACATFLLIVAGALVISNDDVPSVPDRGHDAVQSMQIMVSTESHVAGGALVLSASVVLAIQSWRMITAHVMEPATPGAPQEAVTA